MQRFKAALPCGYRPDNPEDLVRDDNGDYVRHKEASETIHRLNQIIDFERATVATAAKEALEELENGNTHEVKNILKILMGEDN